VFEEFDSGAFKTVDHVVTAPGIGHSASFKEPVGNTIATLLKPSCLKDTPEDETQTETRSRCPEGDELASDLTCAQMFSAER